MEDCLAATAGCDKSGSDWAELCKTNEAADMYEDADSGMRAEYDLWYQDGAINLMREIRELMDNYERGCEALKEDGEDLAAHPQVLYPLLAGMTASQRIILEIGGLDMFIRSLVNNDGYEDERESRIEECGEKLQDLGFTDGKIWLWQGVDQSIYDSKIVETSDSIEKQGAGEDVRDYINEPLRQQFDTTQYALEILSLCWDVFSLVDMGVKLIVGTEVSQLLWVATLYFYHAIQGATVFM